MFMVCPQCGTRYDQRLECSTCKARLLFQDQQASPTGEPAVSWQQTSWGRILIGLVLSQGLYWGLCQLTTAVILGTSGPDGSSVWETIVGLMILQGLLAVSLTFGAILTGAGQKYGHWFGASLGLVSGVSFLVFQSDPIPPVAVALIYATPLLHVIIGGVMGWVGSTIWQPLPQVVTPGGPLQPRPAKPVTATRQRRSYLEGPIAWWRVGIGSTIGVAGTLMASTCLELLEDSGAKVETYTKESLLTGEIIALALLAGSAVAGAATFNGIKQGLITGVLTAALLTGILLGQNKVGLDFILLTALSAIILGIIGGGFGSQLIPPLVTRRPLSVQAMDAT